MEKDVKKEQQNSSAETAATDKVETVSTDLSKEGHTEDSSNRTIPYGRFKEKVDQVKELEKKIKSVQGEMEAKIQDTARQYQAFYESEISKLQRTQQAADPYLGYEDENQRAIKQYEEKISILNQEVDNVKKSMSDIKTVMEQKELTRQIGDLKTVYPSMDEEHCYAIKRAKPEWSLDECAEYSHNHFSNHAKNLFEKMMEEKKNAAKKVVIGGEGSIKLKPEERPKNFEEAKRKVMEFAAGIKED